MRYIANINDIIGIGTLDIVFLIYRYCITDNRNVSRFWYFKILFPRFNETNNYVSKTRYLIQHYDTSLQSLLAKPKVGLALWHRLLPFLDGLERCTPWSNVMHGTGKRCTGQTAASNWVNNVSYDVIYKTDVIFVIGGLVMSRCISVSEWVALMQSAQWSIVNVTLYTSAAAMHTGLCDMLRHHRQGKTVSQHSLVSHSLVIYMRSYLSQSHQTCKRHQNSKIDSWLYC